MSNFEIHQDELKELKALRENVIWNDGFKEGLKYAAQLFAWSKGDHK